MTGALFIAAKLACIYVPNRRDCVPIPQLVTIAGALPTPASYRPPPRLKPENIA